MGSHCRQELDEQTTRHAALVEEQQQLHRRALDVLNQQSVAEREQLRASLKEQHEWERGESQRANQLAVEALREALQQQGQQQLEQERLEHGRKMADLQVEMTAQHDREKSSLREEGILEIKKHRDQLEKLLAERRNEVCMYVCLYVCMYVCIYVQWNLR